MAPSDIGRRRKNGKSTLEWVLGLFADVRAGEGALVLLLTANIFLILGGYYALKQVREAVTISGIRIFGLPGKEIKAYLPALMALLLTVVVPVYGWLASRVSRLRLITVSSAFVVTTSAVFWLWLHLAGVGTAVGLTYDVWLGIVNVFVIAQFWSYANDLYSEAQGQRLFAIIAIGQSLGAALGSTLGPLLPRDLFFQLPLIAAGLFVLSMVLYRLAEARLSRTVAGRGQPPSPPEESSPGDETPPARDQTPPTRDQTPMEPSPPRTLGKQGGFRLVFRTPYLLLIAGMILVTNVVNTTGEYILGTAADTYSIREIPEVPASEQPEVEARARVAYRTDRFESLEDARDYARKDVLDNLRAAEVGRFYGTFFGVVNILAVLMQMLLVSRIFKYLGVRTALFILPVISLGGYTAIGVIGGLTVLRVAKSAENATDYSLQNTVKQALFLPTSREAKYKAKAAIDTFFVRIGDTLSAAVVFVGLHFMSFRPRSFAFVNVALVVLWLLINAGIAREHAKRVPDDRALAL